VTLAAAATFGALALAPPARAEPEPAAGAPPARLAAPAPSPPATARPPAYPDIVVPAAHGLALMTVMRVTATFLWPDPFARTERFGAAYREAFTKPPLFDRSQPFFRWDGDPVLINAGGHALFGSELYVRARACRFGPATALAFTAATSALWEYGFEANGVRPSALDLAYTPIAGLVLGEARFAVHRAASSIGSGPWRRFVKAVVDPLGELERAAGTPC
jgi:hypothetical protein